MMEKKLKDPIEIESEEEREREGCIVDFLLNLS